ADLLVERELAEHQREGHQRDREHDQDRQHLVAHGLAEGVERDRPDSLERRHQLPSASRTNSSSRVSRCGAICMIDPPPAKTAAAKRSTSPCSGATNMRPSELELCSPASSSRNFAASSSGPCQSTSIRWTLGLSSSPSGPTSRSLPLTM